MTIGRGTPNIRRVHGKNFNHKGAQARLDEAVRPTQEQGLNALKVDSHEVYVYLKNMSSRVCTCKQVQDVVTEMDLEIHEAPKYQGIAREQEINIDWSRPLFGEPNEAKFGTDATYDEFDIEDDAASVQSSIIESSPDCGICFRSGFVPGFDQYGKTRHLFTSQDMVDNNSYTIDRSVGPHLFERLAASGWVLFAVPIPKYFKAVTYSVRNGYEILNEQLWNGTNVCTLADMRANAGRVMHLRVRASTFTHLDITFDLGSDPILANIAQLSKITDWTMFETIGNLNVILPMTIPELPVGSIIIVPHKGMGLRITDVPQLRTSKGHNIDWACTTRVMQPQEPLKGIAKGFRLF